MSSEVAQKPNSNPVIQFSVFVDNRVGRLHDVISAFASRDIHIMAFCQLDSTECTIMRFIVNYPEVVRHCMREEGYAYTETEVIAAEINSGAEIRHVTAALMEAEINIHYLYPFVIRPNDKSALIVHVEDNDLAINVLNARNIRVLDQGDIGR